MEPPCDSAPDRRRALVKAPLSFVLSRIARSRRELLRQALCQRALCGVRFVCLTSWQADRALPAAKDAKLFEEAIALGQPQPCSPQTLSHAARPRNEATRVRH